MHLPITLNVIALVLLAIAFVFCSDVDMELTAAVALFSIVLEEVVVTVVILLLGVTE